MTMTVSGTDLDFIISRTFAAPRALVFRVWTDPVHLARWWGPKQFGAICDADVRPGGRYQLTMVGPDGAHYPMRGRYHEVVPHERIVMDMDLSQHSEEWHDQMAPDRDRSKGRPGYNLVNTITFEEVSATQTTVTVSVRFPSAELRNSFVRNGMKGGWSQSLDKCEQLVDELDREVVITRDYDFPPALVFKAWTAHEHLMRWFGPDGFSITTHEMAFQPGGTWRFTMHGPDGTDFANVVRFHDVDVPRRIRYQQGDNENPEMFETTVTFDDLGGRTRLTLRSVFPTAEGRNYVVDNFGAIEGGHQTVARLAEYVSEFRHKLVVTLPADNETLLTRVFDAPRHLVFEAMTKPGHVRRWWGAMGGMQMTVCDIDLQVGGKWRYELTAPDGTVHPFCGEYREIVPPARVVSTERYDVEPFAKSEYVVTMTLEEDALGRTVMNSHCVYPDRQSRDGHLQSGMEAGANTTFENLATLLADDTDFGAFDPADEIVITRDLAAPRDLVYRAWTQPEHLVKWWGPKGFNMEHVDLDLRAGGRFLYGMRSGQGQEMWGRFIFRDVVEPERIVYVLSFSNPDGGIERAPFEEKWPLEMLQSLTLTESADGRGTTLTLRGRPLNATAEECAVFRAGHASMQGGFGATFDQLVAHLATMS